MTNMKIENANEFLDEAKRLMDDGLAYAIKTSKFNGFTKKEELQLGVRAIELSYASIEYLRAEIEAIRDIQEKQKDILEELRNLRKMIENEQIKGGIKF